MFGGLHPSESTLAQKREQTLDWHINQCTHSIYASS